ncbi:MAG: hypothetical protein BWY80_01294 [Firmicutes bacterium ADurb.Bin456]|nr:MAG: hypothetical protein BWY80_01294 [Firmicutes bacterium ADurb.Bin456]
MAFNLAYNGKTVDVRFNLRNRCCPQFLNGIHGALGLSAYSPVGLGIPGGGFILPCRFFPSPGFRCYFRRRGVRKNAGFRIETKGMHGFHSLL